MFFRSTINIVVVSGFVTLAVVTEIWPVVLLTVISLKELYFYLFVPYKIVVSLQIEKDMINIEFANRTKKSVTPDNLNYTKEDNGEVQFLVIDGVKYHMNRNLRNYKKISKHLDFVSKEQQVK